MYCVGDEIDQYFGSKYAKDPNILLSPTSEILETIETMKLWYRDFPKMRLCVSNHGLRWKSRAAEAGIPELMMKSYQRVIEAPERWHWQDEWLVKASKMPFRIVHGMGYSGKDGHRNAAIDGRISTAIGHLHAYAAVDYIQTSHDNNNYIWAMNTGSLIDGKKIAFAYGKWNRQKPCLTAGVVIDAGRTPILIPYE